jgi:YggT family protein
MPYNRYLSAALKFVSDVTDPYLNLFRRFLPPVRLGPGAIDLSPIVATFVLIIVSSIVANIIRG